MLNRGSVSRSSPSRHSFLRCQVIAVGVGDNTLDPVAEGENLRGHFGGSSRESESGRDGQSGQEELGEDHVGGLVGVSIGLWCLVEV